MGALVISSHRQRPSPTVQRVGVFTLFTRLPLGSLALRPVVLHPRNSRPPVTRAPLRDTTKVYEQLLWRDLNPQVNQPVTAYVEWRAGTQARRRGLSVPAAFAWRCLTSRVVDPDASPPSSNRACGFPAHGFPMFFTAGHALSSNLLTLAPCTIHTYRRASCF
jgi:hypothetical protein